MSSFWAYLFPFLMVIVASLIAESSPKHSIDGTICRFIGEKFIASYPSTSYPIIYEPISRGQLTIWTGISTLPTSEFRCYKLENDTNKIALDFAHFANKLDWTFYDMNKGVTHNGVSVNHCEDYTYKFDLKNKQSDSYMECDTVSKIELLSSNKTMFTIHTTCNDCSSSMLELINAKIKELIRRKLEEQLLDNLFWHLSGLITNQHFNGPVLFKNNLD